MDATTPAGVAWAAYYRPGMTSKEARAFIAGFQAASPDLEYAWRFSDGHYWPFSLRDDEEGETLDAVHDAARAEWFAPTDEVHLYVREKATVAGEWRRA